MCLWRTLFNLRTQFPLECRDDNLCRRLDAYGGCVDDQVVAQRVSHIVTKMAADQLHSLAIDSFDLNPGSSQSQALLVGDPLDPRVNWRNQSHTQTKLTGQNEPCSTTDDNDVPLMTERKNNLLQVALVI